MPPMRVCCHSEVGKFHIEGCKQDPLAAIRRLAEERRTEAEISPRAFYLNRLEDASGVSGTGIVAHGVEFADGQCALWWRDSGSIGIYRSLKKLEEIHGHQGRTLIVMTGAS